jgi:NADH-quinone oxidoreductase subunit L
MITALAVWFMVGFPLAGFLTTFLFRNSIQKPFAGYIASFSVLLSFLCTAFVFYTFPSQEMIIVPVLEWFKVGSLTANFHFLIDALSLWMCLIITGVGCLIHVYAIGYMKDEPRFNVFFSYFNLFICFMLLLVLSSSYLGMFVGWEGVGLCSYLLIGFWYADSSNNKAALKAFVINRIGDLGFLLAILMMFYYFGSSNFMDVFPDVYALSPLLLFLLTLCLFIGAVGKSAQIPLFVWLPDAMAGPTPVSALIHAATMVTAGIYMVARSHLLFSLAPFTGDIIVAVGVGTALLGALMALGQTDIKKVLAYSTMSQLGFMVSALGFGAYSAGLFHMTTHAFFKALLFLSAGNVIHALNGEQNILKMGGLRKSIPLTFILFLIGTLAIVGCPPLSGFVSKDSILMAAFNYGYPAFWVLVLSSVLTGIYMFRLFIRVFLGKPTHAGHPHEAPFSMNLPLLLLAVLSVGAGLLNSGTLRFFDQFISTSVALSTSHHIELEWWLLLGTGIVLPVIALLTYFIASKPVSHTPGRLAKLSLNGFYINTLFVWIFEKGFLSMSKRILKAVETATDALHLTLKTCVLASANRLKVFQSGSVPLTILVMVMGLICLILQGLFHL